MNETQLSPITIEIPSDSGLEIASMTALKELFEPFFIQAEDWRQKALACKVTDPNDKRGMKFARESRLALREIRITVEKRRKEAKEDSLRRGKAIDGMANIFKAAVEPIEEYLLEQEQFAERIEQERLRKLAEDRGSQIAPFAYEGQILPALGTITEEQFQSLLEDAKAIQAARVERERKAEADRLAAIEAEKQERERMRLENERLRKEAEEREAAAKEEREKIAAERAEEQRKQAAENARIEKERAAERAKAEAERKAIEEKAAAERAEREKAEQEALRLRQAEENRKCEAAAKDAQQAAEKAEQEAAAARAPDKQKLINFAQQVRSLTVPECGNDAAKAVASEIAEKVEAFAKWIEKQTKTL